MQPIDNNPKIPCAEGGNENPASQDSPPTRQHPDLSTPVLIEAKDAEDYNMLWTGDEWRHYHYAHYTPADRFHDEGWVDFIGGVYYGLEAPEEDFFYSCSESTRVWVATGH